MNGLGPLIVTPVTELSPGGCATEFGVSGICATTRKGQAILIIAHESGVALAAPLDETRINQLAAQFATIIERGNDALRIAKRPSAPPPKQRIVDTVVALASHHSGISADIIFGRSQCKDESRARFAAIHVCHSHGIFSSTELGRYFDGRDHTSILHAIDRSKELLGSEIEFQWLVAQIKNDLAANDTAKPDQPGDAA